MIPALKLSLGVGLWKLRNKDYRPAASGGAAGGFGLAENWMLSGTG